MTLDEAIAHAREVGIKMVCSCNKEDKSCGKEHLQLADWLEELKAFRNAYNTPPKQCESL